MVDGREQAMTNPASALAAGVGLTLLMGQLRPTFLSQSELQEVTGIPVLGTIDMNWTDAEKIKRKRGALLFGASFASLFVIYGGVMAVLLLTANG